MAIDRLLQLSPTLGGIPTHLKQECIYSRLPQKVLGLFARTCSQAEAETRYSHVMHCAVWALPESYKQEDKTKLAAIAILKRHPELLFKRGYVKGPSGLVYGSPYQVFLGAGDIWALKTIEKEIIPHIPNGKTIAEEQYKQQFPYHAKDSVYDDRNSVQIAQLEEDLKEIVAAISDDPCTNGKATKQRTKDAIKMLREHLAAKENEVITSGMHSPPEILKIMHEVYNQNYDPWTGDQFTLYSIQVIGSGETVASAVDAQRYKKGLCNYTDENTPPDRTASYYLPAGGVPSDLGESCFIDVYFGAEGFACGRGVLAELVGRFGKLCRAKESALGAIKQRLQHPDQNSDQVRTLKRKGAC